MTITLAIGLGLSLMVAVVLLVQCIACPAQDADELQSRIDRLHEENQELLKLERKYIHEAYNQRQINARRNDRNHGLSMALAESVKALREIRDPTNSGPRWRIAGRALDRIQIPDDQLPTRCYPQGEVDAGQSRQRNAGRVR